MNNTRWQKPHRTGHRYANYANEAAHAVFWPSLLMYCASKITNRSNGLNTLHAWNRSVESTQQLGLSADAPRITWLGHASFLLEYPGFRILLDPVFHDLPLFQRFQQPGLSRSSIADIDLILISHNHRDHLEESTVRHFAKKNTQIIVPIGDDYWMKQWNVNHFATADWWQSYSFSTPFGPLTCTFVPAHHWSQRSIFDRNRSLWGGWVIQYGNHTCYFAGDTAYDTHFTIIAEKFPRINVALLPIGPCEPNRWMKQSHMNAEEAGRAFLDLNAELCIPMHWGTFGFGTDAPLTPLERFQKWHENHMNSSKSLCILRIGQTAEPLLQNHHGLCAHNHALTESLE